MCDINMRIDIKYRLYLYLAQNKNGYFPAIKLFYDGYNSSFESTSLAVFNFKTCEVLLDEICISGLKDLRDIQSDFIVNTALNNVNKYLPDNLCNDIEDIYNVLCGWSEDTNTPPEIASDMFREYVDNISDTLDSLNIDYETFKYAESK